MSPPEGLSCPLPTYAISGRPIKIRIATAPAGTKRPAPLPARRAGATAAAY